MIYFIADDLRLCSDSNSYKISELNLELLNKNIQSADIDISDNRNNTKSDITASTKDKRKWQINWDFKCNKCKKSWPTKAAFDEHYRLVLNFIELITNFFLESL